MSGGVSVRAGSGSGSGHTSLMTSGLVVGLNWNWTTWMIAILVPCTVLSYFAAISALKSG